MKTGTRPTAIAVKGLRKSFGDNVVLDGIDITVPAGTVFSLLGPNGSGKTTTVKILSTLLSADGGQVWVGGYDVKTQQPEVRDQIGVTGQFASVDELMTGRENLVLMGDLNHLDRRLSKQLAAELLERFDLADAADKLASTYSGGMRRRLDLAMTLVGDPQIIFLDEPTTGLDPRSRHSVWAVIRGLVARGVTIFLTTQYLDEADELADRIAVLDHGKIVAEGTSAELKRRVSGGYISMQFTDAAALELAAQALGDVLRDDETRTLRVPSDGGVRSLRSVLDRLDYAKVEPEGLSVHTPDLDDVFLTLTGHLTTETDGTVRETENAR